MPTDYTKPASSIEDLINLLQQRSLIISDESKAIHFLKYVGYYRLAGYWQILQHDRINHLFQPGATFEQVVELYDFDRALRLLIYDSIERIEIGFRSLMINEMSMTHGAWWYTDEALAVNKDFHEANLKEIHKEIERSKEKFLAHHDNKYGSDTYPPAWMTLQALSFGTLSKLYYNLPKSLHAKKNIAIALGLPAKDYTENWITSICVLRNLCAHHTRVLNRVFDFPPRWLYSTPFPWVNHRPFNERLLYSQLISLKFLMNRISPGNHMTAKLLALIAKYPSISLVEMGFPANWEHAPLWQH
jgi:abortive infection bacteriophage resistance protein